MSKSAYYLQLQCKKHGEVVFESIPYDNAESMMMAHEILKDAFIEDNEWLKIGVVKKEKKDFARENVHMLGKILTLRSEAEKEIDIEGSSDTVHMYHKGRYSMACDILSMEERGTVE